MNKDFLQIVVGILTLAFTYSCSSNMQSNPEDALDTNTAGMTYDSLTALKYGADDYGMKQYIFAFLKKGPNRDFSEEEAASLQKAHLDNIGRMAKEGKLALAGPFFGDGDLRGIYIFNVKNIEEAEELVNSDPAIQAGSLKMELMQWYGSAALMAVNELHASLAKKSVTD